MINFKQLRMNMKFVTMSMCMVFALAFSACHKSGVYDPNSAKKVSDLVVPKGFDWSMSEDVALAISSPVETSVSVFNDEACKELLATLPVSQEESTFTLNVKSGTKNLYVQYPQVDGTKSVLKVPVSLARATDGMASVKLPEGTGELTDNDHLMNYPAAKWGTLFFEDLWPSRGDYDFNDMAASYKIQLYLTGRKKIEAIMVSVRLNALGGSLPYKLCLQIDNLHKNEISEVVDYVTGQETGDETGTYKYESDATGDKALFSFDWNVKKGGVTGAYYNTEKEHSLSMGDIDKNIVAFVIYLEEEMDLDNFPNSVFNFFIRNTDNTEIHLLGYEPTASFKTGYDKVVENNASSLSSTEYYRTSDGFVWGLKIPANVYHAAEKVDFLKAYPDFKEWVTSGGEKNQDWYKTRDLEYCIELK